MRGRILSERKSWGSKSVRACVFVEDAGRKLHVRWTVRPDGTVVKGEATDCDCQDKNIEIPQELHEILANALTRL